MWGGKQVRGVGWRFVVLFWLRTPRPPQLPAITTSTRPRLSQATHRWRVAERGGGVCGTAHRRAKRGTRRFAAVLPLSPQLPNAAASVPPGPHWARSTIQGRARWTRGTRCRAVWGYGEHAALSLHCLTVLQTNKSQSHTHACRSRVCVRACTVSCADFCVETRERTPHSRAERVRANTKRKRKAFSFRGRALAPFSPMAEPPADYSAAWAQYFASRGEAGAHVSWTTHRGREEGGGGSENRVFCMDL